MIKLTFEASDFEQLLGNIQAFIKAGKAGSKINPAPAATTPAAPPAPAPAATTPAAPPAPAPAATTPAAPPAPAPAATTPAMPPAPAPTPAMPPTPAPAATTPAAPPAPAPTPAMPPAPAPTPAMPPTPELDSAGVAWDGRIHGKGKKKNKDGTWRAKRGVKPAEVNAVKKNTGTPADPTFADLINKAAEMGHQIEALNLLAQEFGLPSVAMAATQPQIIKAIYDRITQ